MLLERDTSAEAGLSRKALIYSLDGALDGLEAESFRKKVSADYEAEGPCSVILRCRNMPYLTSSGLRSIMTLGKRAKVDGQTLCVCELAGLALEIYTSSGFDMLFPSVADLDAAKELVGGGGGA